MPCPLRRLAQSSGTATASKVNWRWMSQRQTANTSHFNLDAGVIIVNSGEYTEIRAACGFHARQKIAPDY